MLPSDFTFNLYTIIMYHVDIYKIKVETTVDPYDNFLTFDLFSDGGFISHKISANTYPQPVPIKVVDVNIPDKDNHVDPNTDLPVYDDYLVSYHGNQPSTLT